MKKTSIIIILMTVLCGVGVNAQRPVGDTINIGGGDYYYSPRFDGAGITYAYWSNISDFWSILDQVYSAYYYNTVRPFLQGQGQGQGMTDEQFLLSHPDLATVCTGRHITGQEFTTSDDVMVIGLAACPTIYIDSNHELAPLPDYRLLPEGRVFWSGGYHAGKQGDGIFAAVHHRRRYSPASGRGGMALGIPPPIYEVPNDSFNWNTSY